MLLRQKYIIIMQLHFKLNAKKRQWESTVENEYYNGFK